MQRGITGQQENPAFRRSQDLSIGGSDGVRGRARGEGDTHSSYSRQIAAKGKAADPGPVA